MRSFGKQIAGVALSWIVLACLSGCSTPGPARQKIGTLRTIGDNVFRNQDRARSGEGVYEDDTVSTGAASSAVIELVDGGFVQLDENTDPQFSFKVVSEGRRRCVHLYIKVGRVWVDSDVVCFDTPEGGAIINSVVNVEVRPGSATVTVFNGNVLITAPREQPLGAGEQVTLARGEVGPVRRLNDLQLESVAQWRTRFAELAAEGARELEGWCCDNGRVFSTLFGRWQCTRHGGTLHKTESQARQACGAGELEGWCCTGEGRTFFTTDTQCTGAGGTLYKTESHAQEACEGRAWCCTRDGWAFFFSTATQCTRRGGTLYETESEARQACEARKVEGHCCTRDGRVLFTTATRCAGAGGTLYKTGEEAQNDRRCRID